MIVCLYGFFFVWLRKAVREYVLFSVDLKKQMKLFNKKRFNEITSLLRKNT